MKSDPIFPYYRTVVAIGYKYRSQKVLCFIFIEGGGSTVPDVSYLSFYPGNYCNFSISPNISPHMIGSYFIAYNEIGIKNRMCQFDLCLEKYWLTNSGYFRLAFKVALGMGINCGKLLLYY